MLSGRVDADHPPRHPLVLIDSPERRGASADAGDDKAADVLDLGAEAGTALATLTATALAPLLPPRAAPHAHRARPRGRPDPTPAPVPDGTSSPCRSLS